jgi:CHAT domain-containing protein/tetratricopeptide (TPR) repeat protein
MSSLPLSMAEEPLEVGELLALGKFEEALPLLVELEQQWREEVRTNETKEARLTWALSLQGRGSVEARLQQFDSALEHLRLASDLATEGNFGPETLAGILDELGRAEGKSGLYKEAQQSLLRAIEQHEKVEESAREPWLSASQNHLGLIYLITGRYEEAGRIFHETLGQAGNNRDALRFQHECLGRYFYVMRSYAKAAEHLERAREHALAAGAVRKEHPDVVSLTGQIGLSLLRLGAPSFELARVYLEEATLLTRKMNRSRLNDLTLASHLSNLGTLELEDRQPAKARDLFREALTISLELLGEQHPSLGPYHTNLGFAHQQLGKHLEAQRHYRRSADLYRESVGMHHQAYIESELNYLESLFRSNSPPGVLAEKTEELTRHALGLFDDIISFGTERQRLNWLRENHLLTVPCSQGQDPEFISNTILQTKARIIDSLLQEQQLSESNPELARLRMDFEEKQRELDDLLFRNEDQNRVSAVHDEITSLETRLRTHSTISAVENAPVIWKDVQASLLPGSAFVDYVRFTDLDKPAPDNLSYGAVLILPEGPPQWIPLGTSRDLTIWLGVMKSRLHYRTQLLGMEPPPTPPSLRLRSALKRLHDLFWAPVAACLPNGIETVGISPDAELNFVSFAVLMDESGQLLAQKYRQLVYYASARDLLVEREGPSLREGAWSLVGVPEFEEQDPLLDAKDHTSDQLSEIVLQTIDALPDIPGVRKELNMLEKIMPSNAASRKLTNSSEQELRSISSSPVVLHLATHAFLLPASERTTLNELQDYDQAPDHFYRSGLVLTEAKKAHFQRSHGVTVPFDRDGILFSNEVRRLPLAKTRLVTLSSCDSGMGESVRGDGVLGLRRGFSLAGSSAILLSLWPVSDDSTPDFMREMYQLSLATDQIGQAVWETQKRNFTGVDTADDDALEEAVLRYGCFVLCQRGPIKATVTMPEFKEPSPTRWAFALVVMAVIVFLATRKWQRA